MKMAKASQADLDATLKVTQIIGDLETGFMPAGEDGRAERFYQNDAEKCLTALNAILDVSAKGSMFRVAFGMLVLLDPRNEIVDPDADVLEVHPKIKAALERHETPSPAESDKESVRNAALEEVELPWNIVFSMAYLDGVMKGEMQEIRVHWKRVSDYLKSQPARPSNTDELISVNDRLPPVGKKVLGLSENGPIYHGCYFITEHIGEGIWLFGLPITQWMPLPAPRNASSVTQTEGKEK